MVNIRSPLHYRNSLSEERGSLRKSNRSDAVGRGRTSEQGVQSPGRAVEFFGFGMVLVAEAQQLKAKLMLKGKWRPEKMVRKKMPDGAGLLAKVPQRRRGKGADDAAADKDYCDAIDKVSSVFGAQKRSNSTAAEHKMYVRMIDGWLVRKGFGSYVESEVDKYGQLVAVHPRRTASGEMKVVKPQMLIGYLLEMAGRAARTPRREGMLATSSHEPARRW